MKAKDISGKAPGGKRTKLAEVIPLDTPFVVQIFPVYACNFKCVYCFEESSRENIKLDFETQELVIGWLKRRIERLGYKKAVLNYYGGEPLLNPKAIEHISAEMKQWCKAKELSFAFTM